MGMKFCVCLDHSRTVRSVEDPQGPLTPVALAQFELLCKRFKLEEQQVFDAMIKRWIRESRKTQNSPNCWTNRRHVSAEWLTFREGGCLFLILAKYMSCLFDKVCKYSLESALNTLDGYAG